MDRTAHLIVVVASLFADAFFYIIVLRAGAGKSQPHGWAGLRTKATMASPEAWIRAHASAFPIVRDTVAVNALLVIVSLFFPLGFQLYAIQISLGVLIAGLIFGAIVGNKAAKASHGS